LNDNRSNHTGARSITGAAETTGMEPAMVIDGDWARGEGKGYGVAGISRGVEGLIGAAV